MESFETYLLILGLVVAAGALVSGVASRTVLSLPALALFAGIVIGPAVLGLVAIDPASELVRRVTELTLIVILFVDGLEVERAFVRRGWHVPVRALALAMPLTAMLIALAAAPLLGLSWTEALLLGALLSPTDPVLTSSVVTNMKIPSRIRNSLNLESGFNDGLALPAVLIFAGLLAGSGDGFVWWQFLLKDVGLGAAVGFGVAAVSAWSLRRVEHGLGLTQRFITLYAFGISLAVYGLAKYVGGNGFIAVYVAGIAMAARDGEEAALIGRFSHDLGEVLKFATFLIFGSVIAWEWWTAEGWRGALFVAFVLLVARTVALLLSLAGTRLKRTERAFMAWFGPKGVACIAYSLLVLGTAAPGAERVFHLTALVVLASIVVHGASDTPLANRFASASSGKGT